MSKLRVHNIAVSLDGYMAGPDQGQENPLGVGGMKLHEWVFASRYGNEMIGEDDGEAESDQESVDDDFLRRGDAGIGATIMGRNMFGPIRGEWENDDWKGWWGPNPPYHHQVFVLTHHAREPFAMEGGTTFNFVGGGIEPALAQAFAAADGDDVRLAGGASAIHQYLRAGLVDEMHVAIVPVLLGGGERLFDNLDSGIDGYECVEFASSPSVAHVRLARTGS